jgi:hypothetical protein
MESAGSRITRSGYESGGKRHNAAAYSNLSLQMQEEKQNKRVITDFSTGEVLSD